MIAKHFRQIRNPPYNFYAMQRFAKFEVDQFMGLKVIVDTPKKLARVHKHCIRLKHRLFLGTRQFCFPSCVASH